MESWPTSPMLYPLVRWDSLYEHLHSWDLLGKTLACNLHISSAIDPVHGDSYNSNQACRNLSRNMDMSTASSKLLSDQEEDACRHSQNTSDCNGHSVSNTCKSEFSPVSMRARMNTYSLACSYSSANTHRPPFSSCLHSPLFEWNLPISPPCWYCTMFCLFYCSCRLPSPSYCFTLDDQIPCTRLHHLSFYGYCIHRSLSS